MKTLSTTARLVSAAIAVATTVVLFNGVISISEPQRSVLIAKTQQLDKLPPGPATLAMASTHSVQAAK